MIVDGSRFWKCFGDIGEVRECSGNVLGVPGTFAERSENILDPLVLARACQ